MTASSARSQHISSVQIVAATLRKCRPRMARRMASLNWRRWNRTDLVNYFQYARRPRVNTPGTHIERTNARISASVVWRRGPCGRCWRWNVSRWGSWRNPSRTRDEPAQALPAFAKISGIFGPILLY